MMMNESNENGKYSNGRDAVDEPQQPNAGFESFLTTEEVRVSQSEYDISSFVTRSKIVGVQKRVVSPVELGKFPHDVFFRAPQRFRKPPTYLNRRRLGLAT